MSKVMGHRHERRGGFALHVQWKGFEDVEKEWTWEPLAALLVDDPAAVKEYVESVTHARDKARLESAIRRLETSA